jgi:hypothetical protein
MVPLPVTLGDAPAGHVLLNIGAAVSRKAIAQVPRSPSHWMT